MSLNFYDERTNPDKTPDTIYDELMEILKFGQIKDGLVSKILYDTKLLKKYLGF